jgi:DNA repair exonuclease SbcCD nuclease subunit
MSKILLIGDIHLGLGYPNNLDKWFKVSEKYFEDFLFPLIEKEITKDDIIVLLGDLFDNRNVIPINILNYAQDIIERMSKFCPIKILIGNHDLYTKSTNDINSVKLYKYIPNVSIYEESEVIDFMGKSILMMPWVERKKDQVDILKNYSGCEYLFCHSDLNGAKMHLNSVAHKNLDKIDINEFSGYKKVYSGHIHLVQKDRNFTFVGSVHEMDRNDLGNQKGIFILDVIEGTERFVKNDVSPKFVKVYLNSEDDIDDLDNISKKDFIDLFISNKLLISNRKLRRKLEIILENGNFASVDYIDDMMENLSENESKKQKDDKEILENINKVQLEYKEYIREYISLQNYDSKIRNGIVQSYNEIIKIYDENYEKE